MKAARTTDADHWTGCLSSAAWFYIPHPPIPSNTPTYVFHNVNLSASCASLYVVLYLPVCFSKPAYLLLYACLSTVLCLPLPVCLTIFTYLSHYSYLSASLCLLPVPHYTYIYTALYLSKCCTTRSNFPYYAYLPIIQCLPPRSATPTCPLLGYHY